MVGPSHGIDEGISGAYGGGESDSAQGGVAVRDVILLGDGASPRQLNPSVRGEVDCQGARRRSETCRNRRIGGGVGVSSVGNDLYRVSSRHDRDARVVRRGCLLRRNASG